MKNKSQIYIFITTILLTLTSCATGHLYKEPTQNESKAFINIAKQKAPLGFNVPKVVVNEINSKPINDLWKGAGANRSIRPGLNILHVSANLLGSRLTANTTLKFQALPNHTYVINQTANANQVKFYVIDSTTKKTVATKSSKKVVAPPAPAPLYIPIFI